MGVIEALRYFDIPIETFLEMDDRLAPSQKISIFLVFRAIRRVRERRKRERCHGIGKLEEK